jgi:HK97 family phage major capsid protein
MDFPALKEAQGKLDAARASLKTAFEEAGPELDMDKIKSVPGDRNAKVDWIRARNEELDGLKADVEKYKAVERAAEMTKHFPEIDHKGSDAEGNKGGQGFKSLGAHFVESKAFKNKGEVATLDVGLKTLFQTTAGWTPEVIRSGLVTLSPQVPAPSVTDHLVTIPVTQAGYKYMEETTYTNNAAEVSEGSTYGEAVLALTERLQSVEKVAVWLPVTDEQLQDEAGAQAYVEARLQNMIKQRLDTQVLQGNGSPPNLLGTINKPGITVQALGADTLIDASYKAFTTVRTVGFAEPSVGFITAASWQPVMLLKTADGQYIYGNPASGGPSTLWGVPIVQTQAAVAGNFVTGDYANYAFLGVRRGLDLQITNSHASMFINGEQAIRVDTRVVMVHIRPTAFVQVTGV